MRAYIWGLSLSILAVLIVIGFMNLPASNPESTESAASELSKVILYVNGEPVTRQEFQLYMDKEKGAVTNYFSVKHSAEDKKDYWTTEFGGERPIDMLKSRATEEAAKGKLLQSIALSKGLVEQISFEQLLKNWKSSNQEREQDLSNNKAIFGLGQYDQSQFYFYTLSNLKLELEELMGKSELKVSVEEIKQVYLAHAKDYQNRTRLEIEELSIPYSGEEEKSKALQATQAALGQLNSGETSESVSHRNSQIRLRKNTAVVDANSNPLSSEVMLMQAAMKLEKGSWSSVADVGDSYSIVKLVDKTEDYAVPIEEVESQLKAEALSQKFENYLLQQFNKSEVKLDQSNYDEILTP